MVMRTEIVRCGHHPVVREFAAKINRKKPFQSLHHSCTVSTFLCESGGNGWRWHNIYAEMPIIVAQDTMHEYNEGLIASQGNENWWKKHFPPICSALCISPGTPPPRLGLRRAVRCVHCLSKRYCVSFSWQHKSAIIVLGKERKKNTKCTYLH